MPSIAVLVRRPTDSRVLVIKDKKNGWRFPGGPTAIDNLLPTHAAAKHCLNEANVEIEVDGVFRVEHHASKSANSVKQRLVFSAHPVGMQFEDADTVVPTTKGPDAHSECACWMLPEELEGLSSDDKSKSASPFLPEVVAWVKYAAAGGSPAPLNLFDEAWAGPDLTFTPMPQPFAEFSSRESVLAFGAVILSACCAIGGVLVGKYML